MGSRPSRDAEGWSAYDPVTGLNEVMRRVDQKRTLQPLRVLRDEIGSKAFQAIDWNRPSPLTGDTVLTRYLNRDFGSFVADEDCALLVPLMTDKALNHHNKQGHTTLNLAIQSSQSRTLLALLLRMPGVEFGWDNIPICDYRNSLMCEVAMRWMCSYRKAVRAHLVRDVTTTTTKTSTEISTTISTTSPNDLGTTAGGLANVILSFLWSADEPTKHSKDWLSGCVIVASTSDREQWSWAASIPHGSESQNFLELVSTLGVDIGSFAWKQKVLGVLAAGYSIETPPSNTRVEIKPTVHELQCAVVSTQFQFGLSQGSFDYELATRHPSLLDCRQNYLQHINHILPRNPLAYTMELGSSIRDFPKLLSVVQKAGGATLSQLRECTDDQPSALMIAMTHEPWVEWLRCLGITLDMINGFSRQEVSYMISESSSHHRPYLVNQWNVCDEQLSTIIIPRMSMDQLTSIDLTRRSLFALAVQNILPRSVQKLVELKVPVPESMPTLHWFLNLGFASFRDLDVPFSTLNRDADAIRALFQRVNFVTPSAVTPSAVTPSAVSAATKP